MYKTELLKSLKYNEKFKYYQLTEFGTFDDKILELDCELARAYINNEQHVVVATKDFIPCFTITYNSLSNFLDNWMFGYLEKI